MPDLPTAIDELGSVANGVDAIDAAHVNDIRRLIELLSIGSSLPAPRRVGDATDYIELDPANGQINTGGTASPLTINNLSLDIWAPPAGGGSDYTTGLFNAAHDGGGMSMAATNCYLVPLVVPCEMEVDQVAITLKTGVDGKVARCGIYNRTADTRLAQSVQFTVGTGDQGLITASMSYTFGPGIYCLAIASDGAITIGGSRWYCCHPYRVYAGGGGELYTAVYGYKSFSFSPGGDLPTDATPTSFPGNSRPPRICLRPAS